MGKYCKAVQATDVNIIRRMRFAYWFKKKSLQTRTLESVMLPALPRQQLLRERATVSRCTYIECLVKICEGIYYEFGPDYREFETEPLNAE